MEQDLKARHRVFAADTHHILRLQGTEAEKQAHQGLGYCPRTRHAWDDTSRPTDGNSGYPPNADREGKHTDVPVHNVKACVTEVVELHSLTSTPGASRSISRIVCHRPPTANTLVQAQSMWDLLWTSGTCGVVLAKSKENELQRDVNELTTRQ